MKSFITIILFTLTAAFAIAQTPEKDNPVRITGRILNSKTFEPVSFANMLDITRSTGTSADENGSLSFVIDKSDTMRFTAVGYEDAYLCLKDSVQKNSYFISVWMKPKAYLLQEVDIYANDPMAGFRRDTTHTTKYQFSSGQYGQVSNDQGTGTGGSGYITDFANLFNRHHKEEVKLNKILAKQNEEKEAKFRHDSIQMMVNARYNKIVVARITNLTGGDLDEFIKEYRPSDLFILTATDYNFALQIVNSFYDYQKKHGLQVDLDEVLRRAVFKN